MAEKEGSVWGHLAKDPSAWVCLISLLSLLGSGATYVVLLISANTEAATPAPNTATYVVWAVASAVAALISFVWFCAREKNEDIMEKVIVSILGEEQ